MPSQASHPMDDRFVRRRVMRALLLGCEDDCAAACGGMDIEAYRRWLAENPEQAEAFSHARFRAQQHYVRHIAANKDWRARAWLLERLFPELYHPASRAAAGGENHPEQGNPAGDEQTRTRLLDLLDEAEKRWRERLEHASDAAGRR